jgi:hypothetical protein
VKLINKFLLQEEINQLYGRPIEEQEDDIDNKATT